MPTKRFLAALAAAALLVPIIAAPASAATSSTFVCDYRFQGGRGSFSADLAVINNGPSIEGWTIHWTFHTPTLITSNWQAVIVQPSPWFAVATPLPSTQRIPTGGAISFGWTALAPTTEVPTDLTINGQPC